MNQTAAALHHSEPHASRPGLTSLVRTSRGLMTVQTELVGEPAELVTIVDFRGRVLKRWTSAFLVEGDDTELAAAIREWHARHEADVRESLARLARTRGERRAQPPEFEQAISRLFLAGVRAYAKHDLDRAQTALHACASMLPGDPRVAAALARVEVTAARKAQRAAAALH